MRASLMSREVIADSAELAVRGHSLDAVLFLVGCDKTIPGRGDGRRAARSAQRHPLRRLDHAGPARRQGASTIQDVFEAVGAHSAGTIDDAELKAVETAACPGAGACGGQFTANTMALAMSFLGLSPMGLNDIPAVHPDKPKAAVRSRARLTVEALQRRAQRAQPRSPPRACATPPSAGTATAGSTNLVLHLLAIAREAGIPEAEFNIDLFDEVSRATPVIADLKPGGRFMAPGHVARPAARPCSAAG